MQPYFCSFIILLFNFLLLGYFDTTAITIPMILLMSYMLLFHYVTYRFVSLSAFVLIVKFRMGNVTIVVAISIEGKDEKISAKDKKKDQANS